MEYSPFSWLYGWDLDCVVTLNASSLCTSHTNRTLWLANVFNVCACVRVWRIWIKSPLFQLSPGCHRNMTSCCQCAHEQPFSEPSSHVRPCSEHLVHISRLRLSGLTFHGLDCKGLGQYHVGSFLKHVFVFEECCVGFWFISGWCRQRELTACGCYKESRELQLGASLQRCGVTRAESCAKCTV